MTTAHKVSAQGDFFFWLWDKHLVHFSRLVPNQSRHQTLWRYLRGLLGLLESDFIDSSKYFYAPLKAKNFKDCKNSQLGVKILLLLLVQKRGTRIPLALFSDIKEQEESMYMQKKKSFGFWPRVQITTCFSWKVDGSVSIFQTWFCPCGHMKSGRWLEEKRSFSRRTQTSTSWLVCLDPAAASLKHTKHKIFSAFLLHSLFVNSNFSSFPSSPFI